MTFFPTPVQDIIISFIYEWLGESRVNRTMDEYREILSRFPTVEAAHVYVNQRLKEIEKSGAKMWPTYYGRPGRGYIKPYPTSVSMETVRTAYIVHGVRELCPRKRPKVA